MWAGPIQSAESLTRTKRSSSLSEREFSSELPVN